jgi:predicted ferric reductase/Ca2+-binding EF-hand superfamily protein
MRARRGLAFQGSEEGVAMNRSVEPEIRPGRDVASQLKDIETRFTAIAGKDEKIDVEELRLGLGLNDADYARRIFNLVDSDGSGEVTLWEFIEFAQVLLDGSPEEKLRIVFDLHDLNGDGTVDRPELKHILDRSLNEHSLEISSDKLEALSAALFDSVDTDKSGSISFAEFLISVDQHPALKAQMLASSATWLRLPQRISSDRRGRGRAARAAIDMVTRYWLNERPWLVLLALYAAANVWLFREGLLAEAALGSTLPTQIAQGAAEALKLNGAIILVSMLRHTLTFLRHTPVGPFLPLDRAILFHKIVGHVAFALAVVHVGGYITTYERMVDPDFFTRELIYGELIKSREGQSGLLLFAVFAVVWTFSLEFVRRKGWFEAFYHTHRLFWLFFPFFIWHVPEFWMWVVVPGVIFLAEQVLRLIRGGKIAELDAMEELPSNVTRMVMHRPDWFDYQAGEYVFVKHPTISRREWHPFTVTSNPEDTKTLELHVRSVGTWTGKLREIAETPVDARPKAWRDVYLDGPYGSPASDIFDSTVPVLIGAGIGVTPFASILRSFLARRRAGDAAGLEKIYFIWLNRDQKNFEWFIDLMQTLERDPATTDVIDIRVHLTRLRAALTSASLTIAMEVYHEQRGVDLLTGLRAPTRLARPNWREVFGAIQEAHPGKRVDVFYCGPEGLSRVLARESGRFGFGYKKENF